MSLLSAKKNNISHFSIIFDIGSSTVGGALVIFAENTDPCVLYTKRIKMAYQQELNFSRFLEGMVVTLSLVVDDIVKNGYELLNKVGSHPSRVQDIFCVFSSPWYISQTKTIILNEDKPYIVTQHFIDDLIKRSVEQFKTSEKAKESIQIENNAEIIEQRIVEIKLNGYETSNPYGKLASKVELSFYTSMISKDVKSKVSKVITESLHERSIQYHSFALSMYSAIRDSQPDVSDYLIFDFGGEVTDVSIVRVGILVQVVSIPFGSNLLVRKLVSMLNTVPEEVVSKLTLYLKNELHESKSAMFEKALLDIETEWNKLTGGILKGLSTESPLPQRIFHTMSDDLSKLFVIFMKKDNFRAEAMVSEKFNLTALESESLNLFCTFAPQSNRDLFLGMEAVFFEKIKESKSNKPVIA
jgi:hypothetical protein